MLPKITEKHNTKTMHWQAKYSDYLAHDDFNDWGFWTAATGQRPPSDRTPKPCHPTCTGPFECSVSRSGEFRWKALESPVTVWVGVESTTLDDRISVLKRGRGTAVIEAFGHQISRTNRTCPVSEM